MNPTLTLADILRIEDCPEILALRCPDTGIPLWTTIRLAFVRLIMGDLLYGSDLVGNGGARGALGGASPLGKLSVVGKAFVHNAVRLARPQPNFPVIIMATGVRLEKREGKYFNCLSDYFVSAAPAQTLAIEELFGTQWPFPRQHNAVLLQTPLRVDGVVRGRLRAGAFHAQAQALVELACQRAQALIGWQPSAQRRRWLEAYCASASGSLLPRYRKYRAVFSKAGARIVIKEEACYGGADNAAAMLAARHLNIVTAEYQHGAITTGHDAYNYAPAIIANAEYRKIIPDYLLTYGVWWGLQMNSPVEVVAVGNPHRSATLEGAPFADGRRRRILVLGDGMSTGLYEALCARLTAALAGAVEVVFRPHPLERAAVSASHPTGLFGNARIDSNPDIYQSFREAGTVISEVSTGLFEAIGLVPRIFIWDTAKARFSVPSHGFQGFSDADELVRLMGDDAAGQVSREQAESLWAPCWQQNYLEFLEKVVVR